MGFPHQPELSHVACASPYATKWGSGTVPACRQRRCSHTDVSNVTTCCTTSKRGRKSGHRPTTSSTPFLLCALSLKVDPTLAARAWGTRRRARPCWSVQLLGQPPSSCSCPTWSLATSDPQPRTGKADLDSPGLSTSSGSWRCWLCCQRSGGPGGHHVPMPQGGATAAQPLNMPPQHPQHRKLAGVCVR